MPVLDRVLVVGAGVAGLAVATLLQRAGVTVDVVEARPDVQEGSGITLQRNALQVLREVGVLDGVLAAGYPFDGVGLRSADGTLLMEVPGGGPGSDLPTTVGCSRPALAALMLDRARGEGVHVRLGVALRDLTDDGTAVHTVLDDGSAGWYALVIGADGVHSRVRELLGVDAGTEPLGMGIWRVVTARPDDVVRTDLCYDGPCLVAGFCPTGEDSLYAYLVERDDHGSAAPADAGLAHVRDLASAYHGPWDAIRAGVTDAAHVNHTRFETHLLPAPWHRGRVVLVGDAAHVFPPTVAQGAAMALEDASVLAELLTTSDAPTPDVLQAFVDRRYARVEVVADASVRLARSLLHGTQGDVPGLMGRVAAMVAQPA